MDELTECVYEQVRRQCWYRRPLVLSPATHLLDELELEPVDLAQLCIRLECALGVAVPDAAWPAWHTLADVLTTLRAALAPPGSAGPAWRTTPRPPCGN